MGHFGRVVPHTGTSLPRGPTYESKSSELPNDFVIVLCIDIHLEKRTFGQVGYNFYTLPPTYVSYESITVIAINEQS